MITIDDFNERPDAAYRKELERHPKATANLFSILNDEENGARLRHASELQLPALLGVVGTIENDGDIALVISESRGGLRYRQAIGVAVKLRMRDMGSWKTTGKKGSLARSRYFKSAEIYTQ
jgi:hypothetical protein